MVVRAVTHTSQPDNQTEALSYEVTTYNVPKRNLITEWVQKRTRDLFRKHPETTITAECEGNQSNDWTYLQIDMSQMPAGIHQLTVKVLDLYTDQSVERTMLFRIIN